MQNFASQLDSSESHTRTLSRAALKTEPAGRLHFDEDSVFKLLQVDRVSEEFCASCYASIRSDATLWGHFLLIEELVNAAEIPGGVRRESQMCIPLVRLLP